jgi:hypothetical protein
MLAELDAELAATVFATAAVTAPITTVVSEPAVITSDIANTRLAMSGTASGSGVATGSLAVGACAATLAGRIVGLLLMLMKGSESTPMLAGVTRSRSRSR